MYSLLGFALLEINSYLSKKKKNPLMWSCHIDFRKICYEIFFFFWIIKNLLPKRAMPHKPRIIQEAKAPYKRKTDSTSPIYIGKGASARNITNRQTKQIQKSPHPGHKKQTTQGSSNIPGQNNPQSTTIE